MILIVELFILCFILFSQVSDIRLIFFNNLDPVLFIPYLTSQPKNDMWNWGLTMDLLNLGNLFRPMKYHRQVMSPRQPSLLIMAENHASLEISHKDT